VLVSKFPFPHPIIPLGDLEDALSSLGKAIEFFKQGEPLLGVFSIYLGKLNSLLMKEKGPQFF